VDTFIIVAFAALYLIILFVRGGWLLFVWLLLKLIGLAVWIFIAVIAVCFLGSLAALLVERLREAAVSGLIVSSAVLFLTGNVIVRLQRAKGRIGVIGRIMFGDEKK
jgi:hypothetical protein